MLGPRVCLGKPGARLALDLPAVLMCLIGDAVGAWTRRARCPSQWRLRGSFWRESLGTWLHGGGGPEFCSPGRVASKHVRL